MTKPNTKKLALFSAAVLTGGTLAAAALDMRLTTVKYIIGSPKVSGRISIAFISDLHNSLFGKNQSELIAAVDKTVPNIVVFGGDLADKTQEFQPDNSFMLVKNLVKKYPCYYTIGNHESRRGDSKRIKRQMSDMGVTVLEGNGDIVQVNGTTVEICGIYDANTADYDEKFGYINQLDAVTDNDSKNYRILLAHFPEQIEEYVRGGFDLVLSGHAHGGQWRVPGLINGIYAPGQGFFPKYAGGLYRHKDTVHIVSRGLWKPSDLLAIPRLFIRPELVEIIITNYDE